MGQLIVVETQDDDKQSYIVMSSSTQVSVTGGCFGPVQPVCPAGQRCGVAVAER